MGKVTAIVMPGSAQAMFRENIEEYQKMIKRMERFEREHRRFAKEECNLYYPDFSVGTKETSSVHPNFCHSACHPHGYGPRRVCNISVCTWHLKEAHEFEDPKPF